MAPKYSKIHIPELNQMVHIEDDPQYEYLVCGIPDRNICVHLNREVYFKDPVMLIQVMMRMMFGERPLAELRPQGYRLRQET